MAFMNFVAYAVLNISLNLVSMQNLWNVNNYWHKQNLRIVQRDLIFNLNVV